MAHEDPTKDLTPYPGITLDQFEFVLNFLTDRNVTASAERFGIARKTASTWLKKPAVKKMILAKAKDIEQRCNVTIDECMNELKRVAFFDHKDYMKDFKVALEEGGTGVELHDFADIDTRAIKRMTQKINAQGIPYVEIEPYNKVDALEKLIEHLKGYQGPAEVHLHLSEEQAEKMTSQEIAANYQIMVEGDN